MSFPLSRSSRRRVEQAVKPGTSKTERDEALRRYGLGPSPGKHDHDHNDGHGRGKGKGNGDDLTTIIWSLVCALGRYLLSKIHRLVYNALHLLVSVCVRVRFVQYLVTDFCLRTRYYHHDNLHAIRRDVAGLKSLPEHLSVLLTLEHDRDHDHGEDKRMKKLIDQVADLAAWSACAGIPLLSVYEQTGILKSYMPSLYRAIAKRLASYYKRASSRPPVLNLYAPHQPIYKPAVQATAGSESESTEYLTVLLLSEHDGRDTFVDLVKTLIELAQSARIAPSDISVELVNTELCEVMAPLDQGEHNMSAATTSASSSTSTSTTDSSANSRSAETSAPTSARPDPSLRVFLKPEPDFLLLFTPCVRLHGYPAWQIRLTEMYCTGDKYNAVASGAETVEYHKFLRGLWRYAKAEMRFGR